MKVLSFIRNVPLILLAVVEETHCERLHHTGKDDCTKRFAISEKVSCSTCGGEGIRKEVKVGSLLNAVQRKLANGGRSNFRSFFVLKLEDQLGKYVTERKHYGTLLGNILCGSIEQIDIFRFALVAYVEFQDTCSFRNGCVRVIGIKVRISCIGEMQGIIG